MQGIYQPDALIERADQHLTDAARTYTPEQCLIDIRAAGRCLVFDVETASAFHMMRAIESASKEYRQNPTLHPEVNIDKDDGLRIFTEGST